MKLKKQVVFCLAIVLMFAFSGCEFLFTDTLPSEQVAEAVPSEEQKEESSSIPETITIPELAEEDSSSEEAAAFSNTKEELPPEEAVEDTTDPSDELMKNASESDPKGGNGSETEEQTPLSSTEEYVAQIEPETMPASMPQVQPSTPATQPSVPDVQPTLSTPEPTSTPNVPSTNNRCKEHDLVYTEPVPATCTEYGQCHWTCKNCDFTYDAPLSPTGHNWDNGQVTTPATCGSAGIKTFSCRNCQLTRTETIAAQGSHNYVATSIVAQTKIGTMADLGYTIYTCTGCNATMKSDYEGYLDCGWRYAKVNEYRTSPGRWIYLQDGGTTRFNEDGCTQLQPFAKADGLESIAKLRAKQEAYDLFNEGRLDHSHDGLPSFYYYGNAFWGGFNCECCEAGGSSLDSLLDATFRNEEERDYSGQGHLRIELSPSLKYIGIGAYVYKGWLAVVCEYSDIPN